MRYIVTSAMFTAVIAASGLSWTSDASARIACKGRFQVVKGNLIATPYCEDMLLAKVAREFGMRVSFRQLRSSHSTKSSACRFVGHDNRVSDLCQNYRRDDRCGPLVIGC